MLNKIHCNDICETEHNFLYSKQYLLFKENDKRYNMGFGAFKIINDETVRAHSGFATHLHQNMEILTYAINGEMTHKDSLGNEQIISKGDVQYMSAGSGIYHSEFNETDKDTRLFQIWLLPNIETHDPNCGFITPKETDLLNNLYGVINTNDDNQFLKTNVKIYLTKINEGKIEVPILTNEMGYLINIEGVSIINDIPLEDGDALKFDENLIISGHNAHLIILITELI